MELKKNRKKLYILLNKKKRMDKMVEMMLKY